MMLLPHFINYSWHQQLQEHEPHYDSINHWMEVCRARHNVWLTFGHGHHFLSQKRVYTRLYYIYLPSTKCL